MNPISVLANKIPSATLDAFRDYCKENSQAEKAVNTVMEAFSPDSIGEFIKNCKQVPLPTDAVSFKEFCSEYKDQLRNVQEAPKVEANNTQEAQGQKKIPEVTQVIVKESAEISAKRQEILSTLTP